MKSVLVCLLLLGSLAASAQGLIFSQVESLPFTLKLQRGGFLEGISHSQVVGGQVQARVDVIFFDGLEDRLEFPSGEGFLNCKGKFNFIDDMHGMRKIAVERLDLCVDDEGVPQYVRPGISREQYDLLFNNITAELSASPMGANRIVGKDVGEVEAHEALSFGASLE
jgi:hypothetical protein